MKLRPLTPMRIIKVLTKLGFVAQSHRGSHIFFKHADGRSTTVLMHGNEEIGVGLLSKIIKDIKIERDEFLKLL